MNISVQEKVNLSFFFIFAYENIIEMLKPFGIVVNELYQDDNYIFNQSIRRTVGKNPNKKKHENLNLKKEERYKILIDCQLLKEEDIESLSELTKIRNRIAHEAGSIFFDDLIDIDYFKIERLIKLYKSVLNELTMALVEDNPDKKDDILKTFILNDCGLTIIYNTLFKSKKFDRFRVMLKNTD